ncbi:MAG: AIPR family protein [Bacteroidales bacterium]|nr:AIPR family protein [Bacteroidales bacterium]
MELNLKDFARDFMDLVKEEAVENGTSVEQQFTETVLEYIKEEGAAISPELFYCVNKDCTRPTEADYYKINAFDYSESSGILDLFITSYIEGEGLNELSQNKIERAHNALMHFLTKSLKDDKMYQKYLVEDSEVAEVIETIRSEFKSKNITLIRFFVLSNGQLKKDYPMSSEITVGDTLYDFEFNIWDISAIRNSEIAAQHDGAIVVDFETEFANSIECLEMSESNGVKSYLAIMPAIILAKVYKQYKTRLLNQNVRNYLGGTIKVNKGMAKTLREAPSMFFAYNNGISSTASRVGLRRDEGGKLFITNVTNWQIVNGGQTTNTIFNMYSRGFDLKNAFVTLKVSEINFEDEKKKSTAISEIARFANSQTQIKESDLAANIDYMLKLDDISKSEWTPANSARKNTQWFFERMRGQYDNAKGEPRTKKAKDFVSQHPKKQRFTKTDIAKWEMAWSMRPDIASKGGEQSFDFFHKTQLKTDQIDVDKSYFRHLIAKAIIYQSISDICKQNGIRGYVNIICNYVLATLAWKSRNNLDLDYVWNHQEIHPSLRVTIEQASDIVNKYILKLGQEGLNPTVKAKKDTFWKEISLRMVGLPELDKALLSVNEEELTAESIAMRESFEGIQRDIWKQLSAWGKEAKKLSLLERKKLDHIYALIGADKKLPFNIISDVMDIYKKSQDMGFTPQTAIFNDNE